MSDKLCLYDVYNHKLQKVPLDYIYTSICILFLWGEISCVFQMKLVATKQLRRGFQLWPTFNYKWLWVPNEWNLTKDVISQPTYIFPVAEGEGGSETFFSLPLIQFLNRNVEEVRAKASFILPGCQWACVKHKPYAQCRAALWKPELWNAALALTSSITLKPC